MTSPRRKFDKHAGERLTTPESPKVKWFDASAARPEVTTWLSARDCPGPSLLPHHGSGSRSKYSNWNKSRRGRLIVPMSLLAIPFFSKESDEVQEAIDKLKNVDELEMFLRRAKLAEHRGEWHDAAEFYHQALSILNFRKLEAIWDEPRVLQAQIYIYDNMANLALSRGRLNDAEALFKETVKGLLASGRAKDDNAIVEVSLKLAMIYAMQIREKDAEAGYNFCTSTMKEKVSNMHPVDENALALYGMCINSFYRFLIIHNRLEEAEAVVRKTIDVALRALSKDHAQVAVLYSDLAAVASLRGNQVAAKEHIDKAIVIAQKVASPDVATFLCNKGLICIAKGECAEATRHCRKALLLAKELNDKDMVREAELCIKEAKEKPKKA